MSGQRDAARELLATLRALETTLTLPGGGMAERMELAAKVWTHPANRGHAVRFVALNAARRLAQAGVLESATQRDALQAAVGVRLAASVAAVDLVTATNPTQPPVPAMIDDYVTRYGLPGLMVLVQVGHVAGRMLVEHDADLGSLDELLRLEALADERDWEQMQRGDDT